MTERCPEDKIIEEMKQSVSFSGFPFQKQIEKMLLDDELNDSNYYPYQTECPVDIPIDLLYKNVIPPSIDILLKNRDKIFYHADIELRIPIECKKTYKTRWIFIAKSSGHHYTNTEFPIFGLIHAPNGEKKEPIVTSTFQEIEQLLDSDIPVCINGMEYSFGSKERGHTKREEGGRAIISGTGRLAIASFFLLNQKKDLLMSERSLINRYFQLIIPVLVTNSKLYIVDSDTMTFDFDEDKCSQDSIHLVDVPWLVYEQSIPPSLVPQEIKQYIGVEIQPDRLTKIGVFVVNSSHLIDFLKLLDFRKIIEGPFKNSILNNGVTDFSEVINSIDRDILFRRFF